MSTAVSAPGSGDCCDLVILGSGSTAFAAALTAQALGKTAVMIESRAVGGTCVNRGCLPSKNLIEAAKLVFDARHADRYPGLEPVGDAIRVGFAALIAQKDEVIRSYRDNKYDGLVGGSITVENGHARFVDPYAIEVNSMRIAGKAFLVATGSRPAVPNIPGLADVPYLTSDLLGHGEEVELKELPSSLVIVGGDYIALELGQMFARFGTRVTILERNGQLLANGYEPQVGRAIGRIFKSEGIAVVLEAKVTAVRPVRGGVIAVVRSGEEEHHFRAERLLVATGRQPNTDDIGLEAAGVPVNERGEVDVDAKLRTGKSHIFAAGDVIGGLHGSQMATPVGARQGVIAARNALSGDVVRSFDSRVIPRAIFTDPQIGIVGVTEAEAVAAGHRCWCTALPLDIVPRSGATRDPRGIVKMVADADTSEVLGVAMVGTNAAEVIHEAAMAMRFRATIDDFVDLLHVYPTMAEALKIIAIARTRDPRKLSCCAE